MDNSASNPPSTAGVPVDHAFLKNLRRMDTLEGVSTLVLFFIAVPLKHFADMPLAVRIVGPVHGILFITLVVMFVMGIKRIPLEPKIAALGILAAFVPFGPFLMNRVLARVDRA